MLPAKPIAWRTRAPARAGCTPEQVSRWFAAAGMPTFSKEPQKAVSLAGIDKRAFFENVRVTQFSSLASPTPVFAYRDTSGAIRLFGALPGLSAPAGCPHSEVQPR